jgi:invasion protein IalB
MIWSLKHWLVGLALMACGPVAAQQRAAPPAPAPAQAPPAQAPQAQAPPAQAPPPGRTTATYDDWTLRCEGTPPARACELAQLVGNRAGQPVVQIALGRTGSGAGQGWKLVMLIPVNVSAQLPFALVPDERARALPLVLRACGPAGCLLDAEFREDPWARLGAREAPARLEYRDAGQAEIALAVSLRGLQPALQALAREPAPR